MPKVKITETVLRDAHQSLIATRMSIDEMLPIMQEMDKIGYYSAEVWGGATFDACIRFLDEDPWERLRIIRKNMPNTKLQMLSEVRICWATVTMPTMFLNISFRRLLQTVWILSVSLMR